ncbi:MAG: PKD domain-containing protein [Opitutaceae bacterium]|nr:PKD domain-containing protein [Opitutaceae bacterium]
MKNFKSFLVSLAAVSFFLGLNSHAATPPPGGGGGPPAPVAYFPSSKIMQGDQPLLQSYTLSITSPSNLPAGVVTPLTMLGTVLSKPEGVDDGAALSFLSFSPSTLAFTGPNEVRSVTVTVDVPLGNFAGNYAYRIKHTGWPSGVPVTDEGATVNALVSPAATTDESPPTVILQSPVDGTQYVYYPATGEPAKVPVFFEATVNETADPINGLLAYINGVPQAGVTTTGIGTHVATGSLELALVEPGTYAVRVTASNQHGTSEDSGDFTVVVSAPPPTISVASPAPGSNYTFPAGGTGVSVPVTYTATSLYGNITATNATLNGAPIPTLQLDGVGTSLVATGSATLSITTPGSYVLNFTAANAYDLAVPVTVPFTVSSYEPLPTVTIVTPEDDAVFTRTLGDPATAVNFSFTGGTDFGTVESVTVLLDGEPVVATINGEGTASITGSFTQSFSTAGTHTLTVTLNNGYSTATDSTTFTIKETSGEICANLTWLPPISLNKTVQGGSVMPIKFTLQCQGEFVRNESVLISIYEILPDGTETDPVLYPYGSGSPNPAEYAITGPMYHLNYPTAEGVHRYRIEVYLPLSADGTNLQLLGTKDLLTKGDDKDCKSDKSNKSGKSDKSDKSFKSDKSNKSGKSDKSIKSGKSDKWGKSDKSIKSDKSDKSSKSNKSDKGSKSDKSGKSDKYSTGNPGNHKSVGGAGEQPDGRDNWGSGDKGKSNGKSDKGKTSSKSKYPSKR